MESLPRDTKRAESKARPGPGAQSPRVLSQSPELGQVSGPPTSECTSRILGGHHLMALRRALTPFFPPGRLIFYRFSWQAYLFLQPLARGRAKGLTTNSGNICLC